MSSQGLLLIFFLLVLLIAAGPGSGLRRNDVAPSSTHSSLFPAAWLPIPGFPIGFTQFPPSLFRLGLCW